MKKFTKMIVGVFAALLLVTTAFAADTAVKATNTPVAVETVKATNAPAVSLLWNHPVPAEAWTLTLGGVGSTATTGDKGTAFGVDLSLGRTGHLWLPLEAGVRQSVGYTDSSTVAGTKLYADWTLLTIKKLDLFAGGNLGVAYGNAPLVWTAAPEAGLRYWLKKDVALEGRTEFPFNLNDGSFNDTVTYVLGVKVKF